MTPSRKRNTPRRRGSIGVLTPLGSAYRFMRSFRVVLALKPADGSVARATFARLPVMTTQDRIGAFEGQTARIEAMLLVLEEDTARWQGEGEGEPAGIPLRRRNLDVTKTLLHLHLDVAAKLSKRTSAVTALRDALDGGPSVGGLDAKFLAGSKINLERVADVLYLYEEVRSRLYRSKRTGGDEKEVVA